MSDLGDLSLKLGSAEASLSNPRTILGGHLVNQVQNQSSPSSTQNAVSPNLKNEGLGEVNGVKTPLPISQHQEQEPEATPSRTTPKRGRPKKGSDSEPLSEVLNSEKNPDWLPEGWKVVTRVRPGGKTAGAKDTYYREPINNRQFRSKREVLEYMASGARPSPRKKQKTIEDEVADAGSSLPLKSPKPLNVCPDKNETPDKIKWVVGDGGNSWTPFIGGEMVPEQVQKQWAAMFQRGAYH